MILASIAIFALTIIGMYFHLDSHGHGIVTTDIDENSSDYYEPDPDLIVYIDEDGPLF